jgi:hypothetical protein
MSSFPETLGPRPAQPPQQAGTPPAARINRALACEVEFAAARTRLARAHELGYLHLVCGSAYETGIAMLPDRAPGDLPPPRLETVSIAEPESGPDTITLPVRWQASAAGQNLRVLDAELVLTARGRWTRVLLDGSFQLPLPPAGPHTVSDLAHFGAAAACAESLLGQLAEALTWHDDHEEGRRPTWRWINHSRPAPA